MNYNMNDNNFDANYKNNMFNNNFNFNNMNINNNNSVNKNINNNINTINKNDELKKISFKLENGSIYDIVANDRFKLKDIYFSVLEQINNTEYSDLRTLKFVYKGKDVTSHFLNDEPALNLNLEKFNEI